jgi:hypothetical protein
MPPTVESVDSMFTTANYALGIRKRRITWASELAVHPTFGLGAAFTVQQLQSNGLELIDPRAYLTEDDRAMWGELLPDVPLVPCTVPASNEWRRANNIAAALAAYPDQNHHPEADCDGPWFTGLNDTRVLKMISESAARIRGSVCRNTPPCDTWSLRRVDSHKHACAATVPLDPTNVAAANKIPPGNEPEGHSRRARANRRQGPQAHATQQRTLEFVPG